MSGCEVVPWGAMTAKLPSCCQASSGVCCGAEMGAHAVSRLDGASVEPLASFFLGVEIFGKVTELEGGECGPWDAAPCVGPHSQHGGKVRGGRFGVQMWCHISNW